MKCADPLVGSISSDVTTNSPFRGAADRSFREQRVINDVLRGTAQLIFRHGWFMGSKHVWWSVAELNFPLFQTYDSKIRIFESTSNFLMNFHRLSTLTLTCLRTRVKTHWSLAAGLIQSTEMKCSANWRLVQLWLNSTKLKLPDNFFGNFLFYWITNTQTK